MRRASKPDRLIYTMHHYIFYNIYIIFIYDIYLYVKQTRAVSLLEMNRPSAHLSLSWLLPTVTALLLVLFINSGRASRITIKDNGYDNIVVAISPSVPANQSDIVIQNIKVCLKII